MKPAYLLLAGMGLVLLAGVGMAASCTEGVDCYCDRVHNPSDPIYDPNVLLCEDFEDLNYYLDCDASVAPGNGTGPNGITQCWWAWAGDTGRRGSGSKWVSLYDNSDDNAWGTGEASNPKRGYQCNPPGQGCFTKEWVSQAQGLAGGATSAQALDLWQGNDGAGIDIQRTGDVGAENGSLTLTGGNSGSGDVFEGLAHFAYRVDKEKFNGIQGITYFSEPNEIGFTGAYAYSSNLSAAVPAGSWSGDMMTTPWKHEEWGNRGLHIFIGNTGLGSGCPFCPAIPHDKGASTCNGVLNNINLGAGTVASCNDVQLELGTTSFDRSQDWPLGTWGCVQGYLKGINSNSGEYHVWFNGQKVLEMTNVNWNTLWGPDSQNPGGKQINSFSFNSYYNGNGLASTQLTQNAYRYLDNVHITPGAPVSCEQIGFNFGPPVCGDGSCNGAETFSSCPADCPAPPQCGDGTCNGSETCSTCSQDCGSCSLCGNDTINSGEQCDGSNLGGATCVSQGFTGGTLSCGSSCQFNTSQCTTTNPPQCGDGTCNGTETCSTCSSDCGVCPPPSGGIGLVGHWKMDESSGSNANDASGNGNNGTINGATRVTGQFGNALDFDGTNDYVEVPNSSELQLGSEITLAAWINPGNQTAQNRIVHKRQGDSRNAYALMISNNERIHFRASACNNPFQDFPTSGTGSVVPIGQWSHVAATFSDASNTVKIYVNGQEVSSTNTFTISPCTTNTEPLQIGGHTGTPRWFDGIIDEVRVYDEVLTASEVQAVYNGTPPAGNAGDLNGDLVVDVFDLVIIGRNFNLTTGFDAAADVNGDGKVDISDLAVVSSNFGNSY